MRLTAALLMLLFLLPAPPVRAQCACLCVDGALKTVCTDAGDAREHAALCHARAGRVCPAPPEASTPPKRYAAPVEGVAHCRDAQVYDASTDGYVTARVCDAVPREAPDAGSG